MLSVLISAVAATGVMALFAGYGKTVYPNGVVSHYYSFEEVFLWAPILFTIMTPSAAVVSYCLGCLLIKLRMLSPIKVVLTGALGGGLIYSGLFGGWLVFSLIGAYYILAGAFSAAACYFLYQKFKVRFGDEASVAASPLQ